MDGWWAASYVVLWAVVAALCAVVVALARQIGTLHLRLGPRGALEMDDEGPTLELAPEPMDATDLDGKPVTIGGAGRIRLLLFVSPGCMVCGQVLPGVRATAKDVEPLVLTDVDAHETARAFDGGRMGVPIVPAQHVALAYDVPGTPYVVVLDEAGVVRAKGTVNNLEQMEGLIDTARRRVTEAHAERRAS